jgi:tetratricopeptide (TPR) repeat protein
MDLDDEWRDDTSTILIEQLDAWRSFRAAGLKAPLRLDVSAQDSNALDAAQDIDLALRVATRGFNNLVETGRGLVQPHIHVKVLQHGCVLRVPSLSELVVDESLASESVGHNILTSVALMLDQLGHGDLAARLLIRFAANSDLVWNPSLLLSIADCMARQDRQEDLMDLVDFLRAEDPTYAQVASAVEGIVLLSQNTSLTGRNKMALENKIKDRIRVAEDAHDFMESARLHYNLTRQLWGRWGEAFYHFSVAVSQDNEYENRYYFWAEVAGLFFDAGQYEWAVAFYDRAVSLSGDGFIRLLHADALMFAGHYGEASESLEASGITDDPSQPAEMRLKAIILPWIVDQIGQRYQRRDSAAADALALTARPGQDRSLRLRKMAEALELDALCGVAWYTRGLLIASEGYEGDVFPNFLAASVSQPGVVESWVHAIVTASMDPQFQSLGWDVLVAAYHRHGVQLETAFLKVIREQGYPPEIARELAEGFQDAVKEVPPREEPARFRLIYETGEFDELFLDRRSP